MNTAPAPTSTRNARWWYVAALLVAVLVRGTLLAEKPFWRDEAWVALLVEGRSLPQFDPQQPRPAPVGFVAAARLGGALPVRPEVGYRLPALLAGIALVPVLGRLASALGAPAPIPLLVVWLAAGAPALVYYSRELKSYGLDALCAALAPLLALRCSGRGTASAGLSPPAATAVFVALVAVAPWFTYGGQFAIGAMLAWGWLAWWPGADPTTRRRWLLVSVVFALSFAAAYRYALRNQASSPALHYFWDPWTFTARPDGYAWKTLVAAWRYATLSVSYVFAEAWPLLFPIAALGAAVWPRRDRLLLLWSYAAPGALAIGAALSDRYLLAEGRLLLFAAPPLLLAAAAGLAAGGRRWRAHPQALALTAAVGLGLAWSATAIAHRLPPYRNDLRAYFRYDTLHDVDALLADAERIVPPGAPVFVSMYASKSVLYYGRGRLADATTCLEPCLKIGDVFDAWVDGLTSPGFVLVLDDERDSYAVRLPTRGASAQVVANERGGQLWEVRKGASQ
jgi:hypothetical protein